MICLYNDIKIIYRADEKVDHKGRPGKFTKYEDEGFSYLNDTPEAWDPSPAKLTKYTMAYRQKLMSEFETHFIDVFFR